MSTQLTVRSAEAIEKVVLQGDLSKLTPEERIQYHKMVCESVGLNPLTKPFEYITLQGKLTLYARKDATDQLRTINQVSVVIQAREVTEGIYVVTARATLPSGRTDESIGAVPIENLKGENRANAMMKAETKAKRRVTLSICGLGMLDETEIESIPGAKPPVGRTTEEIPIRSVQAVSATAIKQSEPHVDVLTVKGTPAEAPQAERVGGQIASSEAQVVAGEAGGRVGAPSTSSAPTREPGSDDEIDAEHREFSASNPDDCIGIGEQKAIHRQFREAVRNKEAQKKADVWLEQWLKSSGYVDAEGKGTTATIPKLLFKEVKDNAVRYAAQMPV